MKKYKIKYAFGDWGNGSFMICVYMYNICMLIG